MKITVEELAGETVEIPAGTGSIWKGVTEAGFRCLLVVQQIVRPEGSPDEDFAELTLIEWPDLSEDASSGLSQSAFNRLMSKAFPEGGIFEPPSPKVATELRAIAEDTTTEPTLRLGAIDIIRAVRLGELSTQEFWQRVLELRRKRDERPPR